MTLSRQFRVTEGGVIHALTRTLTSPMAAMVGGRYAAPSPNAAGGSSYDWTGDWQARHEEHLAATRVASGSLRKTPEARAQTSENIRQQYDQSTPEGVAAYQQFRERLSVGIRHKYENDPEWAEAHSERRREWNQSDEGRAVSSATGKRTWANADEETRQRMRAAMRAKEG